MNAQEEASAGIYNCEVIDPKAISHYSSILNKQTRNQLYIYTPFLLSYVTLLYVVTAILLFTQFVCEPFHLVDECIPAAPFPQTIVLADSFHCLTAGAFAAACAFVLIQIIDTEERSTLRHSQLYCTALINTIAFIGHLCIAMRTFPPVLNVFNREVYIPRLLEWISLVPMLMFMTFCLDIRSPTDSGWMWFVVIMQQISALTGCFANLTTNYTLAVALLTVSCVCFCPIYIFSFRMLRRFHSVPQAKQNNRIERRHAFSYYTLDSGSMEQRLKEADEVSLVLSAKEAIPLRLVLYSTVFWTITNCIYAMGVFNLIDSATETSIQACVDIMIKCVYTQIISLSYAEIIDKEQILLRLLVIREKANAVLRKSIHVLFYKLSSPLTMIVDGMEVLSQRQLSADAKEGVTLVRSKFDAIADSFNDIEYLQSFEEKQFSIQLQRFNLRQTVKDCALAYIGIARENGVKLVLEIDERIPELLLGDKMHLKPVIACLILHGIDMCPHPGGICTITLTTPAETIDATKKTIPLTFSVTDDGEGLSQSEYDSLDSPNSATAFSLTPFRKIVEALSGSISVKTTPKGSCFIVRVELHLPENNHALIPTRVNSTSRRASESLSKGTSTGRKHGTSAGLSLVVDDVASSRKITKALLQAMKFSFDEAEDGDIAIAMCAEREYTVVLIDNKMPRVSGVMAVKTIRAKGFKGIIIGLTGIVDEEELEEFEMSGCDAVITKPLDIAELKRTLRSVKRRRKSVYH